MRGLLALAACLALVAAAGADAPPYSCPASCDQAPGCHCGSTSPPSGLSPSQVPQFIVLTNDDSVSSVTYPVIRNITDRHKNRNGCPMPATWFVQTEFSNPDLIQELYMDNHEIATHTVTHPSYPNVSEILGARTWLNQTAGIPLEKMKGFRAPFLAHNTEQRTMLRENGFLYDSSITEQFGPNAASPNGNSKIWPFTLDYGIPIDCKVGTGTCDADERQPGLWEFPLWVVQDADGSAIASMDPQGDNFVQYQREFERNYNGNRAPLGLYMHAGLLMAFSEHQGQVNAFLDWALAKEDVWVVTIAEILRWMENPVPASEYKLECPTPTDLVFPGGKFCPEPTAGCGQGTWNRKLCACDCVFQHDYSSTGYCPGADGTCSEQKLYNETLQKFYCPGQTIPIDGAPSPAGAPADGHTVSIAFYVLGSSTSELLFQRASAICDAVSRVALEEGSPCEVSNVVDVSGDAEPTLRHYVELTIRSDKPANARLALQSAAQYGALATALQSAGVKYDGLASTDAGDAAPTSEDGGSSGGGSSTAAIVGGVVGGMAAAALAAATVYLVLRRHKRQRTAAGSSAPSHTHSTKHEPVAGAISVLARTSAALSTGYNGSPRVGGSLTPRHTAVRHVAERQGSGDLSHGAV